MPRVVSDVYMCTTVCLGLTRSQSTFIRPPWRTLTTCAAIEPLSFVPLRCFARSSGRGSVPAAGRKGTTSPALIPKAVKIYRARGLKGNHEESHVLNHLSACRTSCALSSIPCFSIRSRGDIMKRPPLLENRSTLQFRNIDRFVAAARERYPWDCAVRRCAAL